MKLAFLSLFIFSKFIFTNSENVYVSTSRGQIFGYHVDYGNGTNSMYHGQADVFLGIPYVMAPVGSGRFQKPTKIQTFSTGQQGAWNATYFRPMCPQPPGVVGTNQGIVISEDCLYLNINTTTKYPIMFWIHGGGLVFGSGNDYDPKGIVSNLVSRDVVVVTINYRIGMLGFFTTLTDDFPPNLGLLDQIEAMKFVQEEISNFGGDPNKVTIFGESAGGCSVSAQTYSPLSKGLFHQAIMESGVIWTCIDYSNGIDDLSMSYVRATTLCNITKDVWDQKNFTQLKECLSNMDYNKFLPFDALASFGWKIAIDGNFMPDLPDKIYAQRPNIPAIFGTNKDEWAAWEFKEMLLGIRNLTDYNQTTVSQDLSIVTGMFTPSLKLLPNSAQILSNIYMPHGEENLTDTYFYWLQKITDAFTGAVFTAFASRDVDYYLECNNTNVYLYEFTWNTKLGSEAMAVLKNNYPNGWLPAYHGIELQFLWMPPAVWEAGIFLNETTPNDFLLLEYFGEFWTNFAKYGTPSPNSTWTPVKNKYSKEYFEFGATPGMKSGYRIVDNYVWNKLIPELIGSWPPTPLLESNPTSTTNIVTTTTNSNSANALRKFSIIVNIFCFFIILKLFSLNKL